MPPLASSSVTYVRVWRLCRCWARARRVEVDAACMLAAVESQLGRRLYSEILCVRVGETGVTGMVHGVNAGAIPARLAMRSNHSGSKLSLFVPPRTWAPRALTKGHGRRVMA